MKHEYAIRLLTSSETLIIQSPAPDVVALRKAINSAAEDLIVVDSLGFGPAVINRRHIVLIVTRSSE